MVFTYLMTGKWNQQTFFFALYLNLTLGLFCLFMSQFCSDWKWLCLCSRWHLRHWLPYMLKNGIFVLFCFNFILFLNFTILYWFCQTSKWIHHRYTCVPHLEPSFLLPPPTIPLGRPSAPAPSIQYRASNLDWWLVPYMILYVFQCHSPKSSHPRGGQWIKD